MAFYMSHFICFITTKINIFCGNEIATHCLALWYNFEAPSWIHLFVSFVTLFLLPFFLFLCVLKKRIVRFMWYVLDICFFCFFYSIHNYKVVYRFDFWVKSF